MRTLWREQLEHHPEWRDMENWPPVAMDSLKSRDRAMYLRNLRVIATVLGGVSVKDTAVKHNLSAGRVSQLLDRALGSDEDKEPALRAGLVPNKVLKRKCRKVQLPMVGIPLGYTGAFQQLLREAPGLKQALDKAIDADDKNSINAQRMNPGSLHAEFLRKLREIGWPTTTYPFSTQGCGYESVRQYFHSRKAELTRQREKTKEGARHIFRHTRSHALDEVQIDEHLVDFKGRIYLQLDDTMIPLRIARASLITMVDVATDCILAYVLTPKGTISQEDLLELLDRALTPWQPHPLASPGLCYPPGAGFPNTVTSPCFLAMAQFSLDNAMTHYAISLRNLLCAQLGTSMNFGRPASPTSRNWVEHTFDLVNKRCSHRLPSTTGSHPRDPIREAKKNSKQPPVVTYQAYQEMLEVVLATHNATPQARLGNASPLALFLHHREEFYGSSPLDPLSGISKWAPFVTTQKVTLRSRTDGKKHRHINLFYVRYSGRCLSDLSADHKYILVEYDRRDVRSIKAFTLDGSPIGELLAPLSWQHYPHSLHTRRLIYQYVKTFKRHSHDPIADYLHHLLENADQPATALEVLKIYTEIDPQYKGILLKETRASNAALYQPTSGAFRWGSDTAFKGGSHGK